MNSFLTNNLINLKHFALPMQYSVGFYPTPSRTIVKMPRIFTIILAFYMLSSIVAETNLKKAEEVPPPIVTTANGQLQGKIELDEEGEELYYSFLSIPYAQAPIEDLRFEDPKPAKDWDGIREATEDLPRCAQVDMKSVKSGVEDCLYLNVFTPQLPTSKDSTLKPVMVFIHGGAFTEGSGGKEWYSPDFLMTEGVVLVTINYRLGIFGFFSLKNETSTTTGNAGLKDQVMALHWVKANIGTFGGDPESVTIFGESAGAACVHYHVLSAKSKGLFTKAIMQSGTALAPWINGYDNNGEALATLLKIDTADHQKMLELLKTSKLEDILNGQILLEEERNQTWGSPVNPTIESDHSTAFISTTPYDIITSGTYNDVQLMIGYNDAEGIAMDQKMRYIYGESKLIDDFYEVIPYDLEIQSQSSIAKRLAEEIETFYYGDTEPSTKDMGPYIQIHTDVSFGYPAYRSTSEHIKNTKKSIYFYRFSADTELNIYKAKDPVSKAYKGASHCDELGYLFKTEVTPVIQPESDEDKASKRLVKLWTTFAKDGKPIADELEWSAVSKTALKYLDFTTSKIEMKTNPDNSNMEFWDKQYDKYFGSYAISVKSSPILVFMYIFVKVIY